MYREITLRLSPERVKDREYMLWEIAEQLHLNPDRIKHITPLKRSIDARRRNIVFQLKIGVHIDKIEELREPFVPRYGDVSSEKRVIVVGAGPAGLFAALRLIEGGIKPIILERGKCVEERKKDLSSLYKTGVVDSDSNYGFGEGGAGAFSDGKLHTRSKKRGNVDRILGILVYHGAPDSILIDAHPHIGSDKLPQVMVNIRKTIEQSGGEIHFNQRVDKLLIQNGAVKGVSVGEKELLADQVILATGHSARDVYRMLYDAGIHLESKEFAVGLRIEHPQSLIDNIQYHGASGGNYLPAAEYSFVTQVDGRGVYSFCMCPGGIVVPAATAPRQQVVNGISASQRNTLWANSAIVTTIGKEELELLKYRGLFGGIELQERLEEEAWIRGGNNLYAPAQRLSDFLDDRESPIFPRTSYKPGVTPTLFHEWLPELLITRLKEAFYHFDAKARGFITDQALLLGVETRTSSPLRIPRDRERYQHIEIRGLYPCGEGAGYAGGIVSAAIDGECCALACAR